MTGVTLRESAPGKVNLCLFVGGRRESDGRHELVSVMASVTLADELTLELADRDEVVCAGVDGPNLVEAAVEAFRRATQWAQPVRITVVKRVPVAAGMGGGSGDAAAALRLLRRASELGDDALLSLLATALGADVPAQVHPGRVLATGAGEHVDALGPGGPLGVLVLPASGPLPTADVYRRFDELGLARGDEDLAARAAAVRSALDSGDLPDDLLVNDLEAAARDLEPSIDDALTVAREAGADVATVSGSGPTVVGLFRGDDGPERARVAAARLAGVGAVAAEPVS
jgi:4-diphosphocytidyl-2-C-methyl-D-erythritol kinase